MHNKDYWKYLKDVVSEYNTAERRRLKGIYWCHLQDSVITFNNQKNRLR